jgi:hypothetical protein
MKNVRNIGAAVGLGGGLLLLPALAMEPTGPSVWFGRLGFDIDPEVALFEAIGGVAPDDNILHTASVDPPSGIRFGKLGFDMDPATALLEATSAMTIALGANGEEQAAVRFGRLEAGGPIAAKVGVNAPSRDALTEAAGRLALASHEEAAHAPGARVAALPEPLSNGELNGLRGGYISAGGFTFDFGVKLETLVDGTLALASTLNLSGDGVTKTTTANLPGVVPLAEAATRLTNLQNITGDGLVLEGNGGVTVLVQDLSLDSIRNLVVNTANDRHIVQNTDITLIVPNLDDLTKAASFSDLTSSLSHALDVGLLNSVRR